MEFLFENLWVLPLLNAAGFLLGIFFGKQVPDEKAHRITLPFLIVSWVMATGALLWIVSDHHHGLEAHEVSRSWFELGGYSLDITWVMDGFSTVMCFMVATIATLVQVFSIGYMKGERRYVQYISTISLFAAGMFTLVLAGNTFLLIFGWEVMGLCSYLLIGHYWEELPNQNAAIKAFLTTRTGDVGLLIGIITLAGVTGTFDIAETNELAIAGEIGSTALMVAAVGLMIGMIGKSAQFPLHTWLPDAMAGPTPVSALIHAATMVVAGVYLVARLYPIFVQAFEILSTDITLGGMNFNILALVGAVTALVGASLAFVQFDIKKVLAYSTISQLGYMIMALGVGAWEAAIFHLFTHAFFKALLFLGSGSVIHGTHHEQDMRNLGGLRKLMPITFWTWIVGTLALAGIIPFSGFFSKDEILAGAYFNNYEWAWIVGLLVAFMTAYYMGRATILTFFGKYRGHHKPHEAWDTMTFSLVILAVFSALAGLVGLPVKDLNVFGRWVETLYIEELVEEGLLSGFHEFDGTVVALGAVALVLAVLGFVLAWAVFVKNFGPGDSTEKGLLKGLRTFLERKLYLDDLYGGIVYFIREPLAKATNWTNDHVIDAVLNGTAAATVALGRGVYSFDQDVLDNVYNGSAAGADRSGEVLGRAQTGRVQQYIAVFFIAVAAIGLTLLVAT